MGISVAELEKQDKKGLENMYLTVSDLTGDIVVSTTEITAYIEKFTPLVYPNSKDPFNSEPNADTEFNPDPYKMSLSPDDYDPDDDSPEPLWDKDGWITSYLTYLPLSDNLVDPNITDAGILAKCSGYYPEDITFDDEDFNRLTGTAIMDSNGVLFERKLRILQRTVEERHTLVQGRNQSRTVGRYMVSAQIEFKFRRIIAANHSSVAPLIADIEERINVLNTPTRTGWGAMPRATYLAPALSINKQLIKMANYIMPFSDDGSNYEVDTGNSDDYLATNSSVVIKVDVLSSLKPKDFTTQFGKHVKSGYTKKKVKLWKKILVAVIIIIVIIVAVILAIPTGGGSINWGAATITLLLGSLALTGLSMYWANNGDPAAAKFAAGGAEILGYLAMATGIAASLSSFMKKEAAKELVDQMEDAGLINSDIAGILTFVSSFVDFNNMSFSLDTISLPDLPNLGELQEVILDSVTTFTAQSTTAIMNQTLNFVSKSFNMYISLISPPGEGLADKQAQIAAMTKEIETLSPDNAEAIWKSYTDPYGSIFEVGDIYEKSYNILTTGRNRLLMNKCYESSF
jgi:hypothetical protein